MEALLALGFMTVFFVGTCVLLPRYFKSKMQQMEQGHSERRELAGRLKFSTEGFDNFEGSMNDVHITLGPYIILKPKNAFPGSLQVRLKTLNPNKRLANWYWETGLPNFQTGDEPFDKQFEMRGEPHAAVALDQTARAGLLELCAYFRELNSQGMFFESLPGEVTLQEAVELCRHLAREEAPDVALPRLVEEGGAVRASALDMIYKLEPNKPEFQIWALRFVDETRDTREKMCLAVALGDKAFPMVSALVDAEALDGMEELCTRYLNKLTTGNAVKLARTLLKQRGSLELEAVRTLGRFMDSRSVIHLIETYGRGSEELRIAVLEALGKIGGDEAHGFLMQAVESKEKGLVIAAAEGLGRCGRVADVERLSILRNQSSGRAKLAIEGAISRIQGRLRGVEAGWISLQKQETAEGGLSLKNAGFHKEGGLSLPQNGPTAQPPDRN